MAGRLAASAVIVLYSHKVRAHRNRVGVRLHLVMFRRYHNLRSDHTAKRDQQKR